MKLNRTTTLFIFFLILTVFWAVVYSFVFKEMGKTHQRIASDVAEGERIEGETRRASALKKLVDDIAPQTEKINSYYVSGDGTVSFIEMVESLGKDAGVLATISSVSDADQKLHLVVTYEGSWQNCMHFISLVQTLPYDISINRLGLNTNLEQIEFGSGKIKSKKGLTWQGKLELDVLEKK